MTSVRRLSSLGDMMFGQGLANLALDSEACAQNVRTRLLLIRPEWFLDELAGVPYLDQVFVSPVQIGLAEATIKQCIIETIDVQAIRSFSASLDHNTRKLSVLASVATVYGDVLNIAVTI